MPARIGFCEDDADLRSLVSRALTDEGHDVDVVSTGAAAIERFGGGGYDLLVLDVGLPDADGRDVCQALRGRGITAPVLFLTARDAVVDRVAGFRAGGDDYLTKPFAIVELIARLDALIRRIGSTPAAPARAGGVILDPASMTAGTASGQVLLTPTEYRLLGALTAQHGAVVSRAALVRVGWPDGATVHANTLDSYLARLRRKLGPLEATDRIVTVRGIGYSLR